MDNIIKDINYDYLEFKKAVKKLTGEYDFLNSGIIGKSVGGRDIISLQLGRAEEYVLLCGTFHGSEHITANILLKFIENLCFAFASDTPLNGYNIKRILTGRGIIFVPMVNPDGAEISIHGPSSAGYMKSFVSKICKGIYETWNANLRGVDINHNFDASFEQVKIREAEAGIYAPCATKFGGYSPCSEPETIAMVTLCRTYKIRHALAFHSQGEVIYADTADKPPHRMQKMAEILSTSSGYALSVPEGTAVGGGFKDWFIEEFNRPAFTVEVGKGKNPLPIDSSSDIYTALEDMLILSIAM